MSRSFRTRVISLGRITIPKDIREKLDLNVGDDIMVEGIKKLVLVEHQNPAKEDA